VAVAKFKAFDDVQRHLRVYAMAADVDAGQQVITEMRRGLDFYESYFGRRKCLRYGGGCGSAGASDNSGLTLVEIPNGWGSYTTGSHIFQQAETFKDMTRVNELYHEVAHLWNARPTDAIQRTRYFDEGFATYFEGLALREFQGRDAFRAYMERSRESFRQRVGRDPRGRTTPIADYGNEELGAFAYSKGAWSLYVLHQMLGEDIFRASISKFLDEYTDRPADFNDFVRSLERTSGRSLQAWLQEWILSARSSDLLLDGRTVEEMAARCGGTSQADASGPPASLDEAVQKIIRIGTTDKQVMTWND
jgi:aminopeptidase N